MEQAFALPRDLRGIVGSMLGYSNLRDVMMQSQFYMPNFVKAYPEMVDVWVLRVVTLLEQGDDVLYPIGQVNSTLHDYMTELIVSLWDSEMIDGNYVRKLLKPYEVANFREALIQDGFDPATIPL